MTLRRDWIASPNYSSRSGATVTRIVLHTAEGARTYRELGNFFANPASGVSSHVGIDDTPGVIGEYVARDRKAWTAGNANPWSVQVELCAFAEWSTDEWMRHPTMLSNTARWIAEEAAHFDIPIVALSAGDAQDPGTRGVCQHNDLGSMGGGHWDCGPGFPIGTVLELARSGIPPGPPAPVYYSTSGQGGPMVTLYHPSDPYRADDVWIGPSDDPDYGPVMHRFYTKDGWTRPEDLGGQAKSVSASWKHDASQFRVVVEGTDGAYENVHDTATGRWGGWNVLGIAVH